MKQWISVNSIKMTNEPIAERSPFAVSAMTSIHAVAPFNATSHPQNEFNLVINALIHNFTRTGGDFRRLLRFLSEVYNHSTQTSIHKCRWLQ